jgi:26S proteasome regulatory subunit N10
MRIVVFVGSPVEVAGKDLIKLAKKLKKEKVNVDLISLGEDAATTEKLSQFIETLNGKEGSGSHLVVVPPGPNLTDALRTSPVVQGEDGFTGGSGDFGSGFDVDPNLDPELALALRVSMEEQRQRQEGDNKQDKPESMATDTPAPDAGGAAAPSNEDALLMNAINSLGGGDSAGPDYSGMTEDEQIALAIQMSMAESQTDLTSQESDTPTSDSAISGSTVSAMETESSSATIDTGESMEEIPDYSAVMSDPAFLQHLVGSLPGVDPNSEAIQNALQALTGGENTGDDENKTDDDKEKEKK